MISRTIQVISVAAALCVFVATGPVVSVVNAQSDFDGKLRVYVVEPTSRFYNYWAEPYDYGFIGFAAVADFSITGSGVFDTTWQWTSTRWTGLDAGNLMAIAVVSEGQSTQGYAHPPDGNPFDAHLVVATAAAEVGSPGANEAVGDYTHTEFIEEGTGTWCFNCPATMHSLDTLFHDLNGQGHIPFYYVSMIEDVWQLTEDYLVDELNIWAYPTCYFGGGFKVLPGGFDHEQPYRDSLELAATREVFPLNLIISFALLPGDVLQFNVTASAGPPQDNEAPGTPSTPAGPTTGVAGRLYTFTSESSDPEEGPVYYMAECGDSLTSWQGPFDSGAEAEVKGKFLSEGVQDIRIKSRDAWGAESEWSAPLTVTVDGICGDANGSDFVDLDDAVYIITYIFGAGQEPIPMEAGDANCASIVDLDDVVYIITYIFGAGPPPCAWCT